MQFRSSIATPPHDPAAQSSSVALLSHLAYSGDIWDLSSSLAFLSPPLPSSFPVLPPFVLSPFHPLRFPFLAPYPSLSPIPFLRIQLSGLRQRCKLPRGSGRKSAAIRFLCFGSLVSDLYSDRFGRFLLVETAINMIHLYLHFSLFHLSLLTGRNKKNLGSLGNIGEASAP